jgi:hypothetical protein
MMKKLQTFALAMLFTGATVTATKAATLYQSLSVNLVLTYQGPATTNTKTGLITDVKESVSLTTPKFLAILASNLGVPLNKGASLVKATTLAEGINITNLLTNATTLVSNATFLESNVIYTNFVFTNNVSTNLPQLITNQTGNTPDGFSYLYETNLGTNLIQGMGNAVILGTNVQYFLNNGSGLDSNNLVLLGSSTDNGGATASASDDAWNFLQNFAGYIDAQGDYYYGMYPLTNFFMAQNITNDVAGIFAGTVKPDFAITGTLMSDYFHATVGPPREAVGSPAQPSLHFSGYGTATATTQNVGSGKSAMPFTSWNATFDVDGGGSLGGTVTNTVNTNSYTYVSNGVFLTFTFEELYDDYGTNPPVLTGPYYYDGTNTIGYTNISTNLYTNYSVLNETNESFVLVGTVKQSFLKITNP